MDFTKDAPAVLSLCPGILGLERGIINAIGHINVVAYVEIEAFIVANLIAGMEEGVLAPAAIWTNVKTFDPYPFRNRLSGIIGGYPCQPFSNAGKRGGSSDPRHLWPYIKNIIAVSAPLWVFFENVAGHLSMGYEEVRTELRGLGYTVKEGLFTAQEVGAPHRRERLFIFAVKTQLADSSSSGQLQYELNFDTAKAREYAQRQSIASCDNELADTQGGESRQSETRNGRESISRRSETELGDTNNNNRYNGTKKYGAIGNEPTHLQQRQNPFDKSADAGSAGLGNADGSNVQGRRFSRYATRFAEPTDAGRQWPARPGYEQYDWEEPRTIEPSMGSTINGYDFKEDLLRAFGNSVVEQTAELAFLTLLNKF